MEERENEIIMGEVLAGTGFDGKPISSQKELLSSLDEYIKEHLLYGERGLIWLRYRWEFMRRDPEYIKAYNEVKSSGKNEERIRKKFGLRGKLINPKLSYNNLVKQFDGKGLFSVCPKSTNVLSLISWLGIKAPIQDYIEYNSNTLVIKIDFDNVNSIDVLKKKIIETINLRWNYYCERSKTKTRKITDYDLILKVGDLRENKKFTYKQIAQKLFPDDFVDDFSDESENANPESAETKVKQYYKRYKELVNGGYRDFARI